MYVFVRLFKLQELGCILDGGNPKTGMRVKTMSDGSGNEEDNEVEPTGN